MHSGKTPTLVELTTIFEEGSITTTFAETAFPHCPQTYILPSATVTAPATDVLQSTSVTYNFPFDGSKTIPSETAVAFTSDGRTILWTIWFVLPSMTETMLISGSVM